jgi:hypothetical protein
MFNVESAVARFASLGCPQIFIKPLSKNQDNEKNQIYLGSTMEIFNVLPGIVTVGLASESLDKRLSKKGDPKLELSLDFSWLTEDSHCPAPKAKLINYFQYPEIRFSGFLSDCSDAPDALRRSHQDKYGQRVLLLGTVGEKVFGLVLNSLENGDLSSLLMAPSWMDQNLIKVLSTSKNQTNFIDPELLIGELSQIVGIEHPAQSLTTEGAQPLPWRGTQGAGYTLEALLGIARNGISAPDKYGFEVKSTLSSPITVITTQPDGGVRSTSGLKKFLELFGWAGAKDDGSLRFNGKHSPTGSTARSGLEMVVRFWNSSLGVPEGSHEPLVQLIQKKTLAVAAEWSFSKLGGSWSRKHAGAVYVEAKSIHKDAHKHPSHYIFGPTVYVCRGTTPLKLIGAIDDGVVYLDSGDRLHADGSAKSRTQWRMSYSTKQPLEMQLRKLYEKVEVVNLDALQAEAF